MDMPGLHLLSSIEDQRQISPDDRKKFFEILRGLCHFDWYETEILRDERNLVVGRSFYSGYPFTVFQDDKYLTVIEGAIYNKSTSNVREELSKISLTECSFDESADKVSAFLRGNHGEFLVVKCDKRNGNCLVFNDALGRLPFYYCKPLQTSSTLIVMSREVKFIVPFLHGSDLDKTAFGEYLLFGYPLGERTLWKDVKRLLPGSMLMTDVEYERLLSKEILSWNLDPKKETSDDNAALRSEAQRLVDLFLNSLSDTANFFPKTFSQTVSLSGGLDSRATLAGLIKVGATPVAYSFPAAEDRVAKKIADQLKVDYHIISSSFKISDEECVRLTDGLIDIGLRSRISYFYALRQAVGNEAVAFTGDGGDKTLSALGFRYSVTNEQLLLQYIMETDQIFGLTEVCSILSLDKDVFTEHLEKHLMLYPERTMEGKFAHFRIFERGFKWLYVGEDRNRLFMWSTTPFYDLSFFSASMEESQCGKEYYRIYKEFLSVLNPILPRIQYYDRLVPLSVPSSLLRLFLFAFDWLKAHFYKRGTLNLFDLFLGQRVNQMPNETKELLLHILSAETPDFFDLSPTIRVIAEERNQSKLNVLATLILYSNLVGSSGGSEANSTTYVGNGLKPA
jgi:asparagine synthase (glutamine-hydrolysing)